MKKLTLDKRIEKSFADFISRLKTPTKGISLIFNILIKKEDDLFIAHCLELDIVATADSPERAQKDLVALICTQIDYAFSNDNLKYLYHPAPPEVWKEFFDCKEASEKRYKIDPAFKRDTTGDVFVPPWLIAKTCLAQSACHV